MTTANKILINTQPVWYLDGVWLVKGEGPLEDGTYTITDGTNELQAAADELDPVRKVETSEQEDRVPLHLTLTFSGKVPEADVKPLLEAVLHRAMEDGSLVHEMWDQRIETMGARCTGAEVMSAYHYKALELIKERIRAERSKITSFDGVITGEQLSNLLSGLLK